MFDQLGKTAIWCCMVKCIISNLEIGLRELEKNNSI